MDGVTVVLLIINLLLWPALGHLALKMPRKDPEIEQLERQLKRFSLEQQTTQKSLQDAA